MAIGGKFNVSMFFDKPAVTRSVDRARIKVLSKFGAFVRTRSRSSIRKRKKVSTAGSPPTSRTGKLKKFIYFKYDVGNESVVIGPEKLDSGSMSADNKTTPEALESGGQLDVEEVQFSDGTWHRHFRNKTWQAALPERKRKTPIAARPFMGPAFQAELPKAPGLWANSVK